MKTAWLFFFVSSLPLSAMPLFDGADYVSYKSWLSSGLESGSITEAESQSLFAAELQLRSLIYSALGGEDGSVADKIFCRLIRNRTLEEIELLAALGELAECRKMQSEARSRMPLYEKLGLGISSEEDQKKYTALWEKEKKIAEMMDGLALLAKEKLVDKVQPTFDKVGEKQSK